MGRPTKLTPERQKRVLDAVRAGVFLETAAEYAGVDRSTLFNWLAKGRTQRSGIYRDFFDAVTRARAEAEVRNVAIIQRAGQEDWRAAAWYLERSFPDRWGRRKTEDNAAAPVIHLHLGYGARPPEIASNPDADADEAAA